MNNDTRQQRAEISINYPPDFQSTYGYTCPVATHIDQIFKSKLSKQREFLSLIANHKVPLSAIPYDAAEESSEARWNQPWFPPLDAMSLYTMIAVNQPTCFLEIGSGNSTKFANRAIRDNNLNTKIISVDPHPRSEVDVLCSHVIRERLENATGLNAYISKLSENDIVFLDGSHRCFQNSDVTIFFIDVLPAIPDGVIVGIHDIFWPNDYPPNWLSRYYNEQYVLGAYMLAMGSLFPLEFSCAYMAMHYGNEIARCLDQEIVSRFEDFQHAISGGVLWFRKKQL
ncbi:MAG: class I SAM-dependent methyltransferase [Planctomycetota bacterium]